MTRWLHMNGWAPRKCQLVWLLVLTLWLNLATHANAKPHWNIHSRGTTGISPIAKKKDHSNNMDTESRQSPTTGTSIKTFAIIGPNKRSISDNYRTMDNGNIKPLISKQTFASGMAFLAGKT